ncbi:MAG TPA: DUF3800 domain-containing protein [Pyrinomonadaceae bacterium]|nr:DUF3800 domain-containing protein [Pyrinomonadaceae bacterium]
MYLCYLDESGTPDSGNTSHYVLVGFAIPIWQWRNCDHQIDTIKRRYGLENHEMHVAWMLRSYLEQRAIPDFESLNYDRRRYEVNKLRQAELYRLQRARNQKLYKQTRKNFNHTDGYIHLTHDERKAFILEVAKRISGWRFARLFAECVDKVHFDHTVGRIDEQAFEQIVSRFERYLSNIGTQESTRGRGLLIHDNNETVAKKHTKTMRRFHQSGTLWTKVNHIYETPMFVDSQLTSMVQIADLCGYAIRRYLENGEEQLFNLVLERADRYVDLIVGMRHYRHYATTPCLCKICVGHTRSGARLLTP